MLRLDINLLWTILNMLIIYGIVRVFLFKPIKKILAARQDEIDKQYADAKSVQTSAEELKSQYEQSLSTVAEEKTGIITEARTKAGEEYDRIVAEAEAQARKLMADAQKTADLEQAKKKQQAQEEIADLVVAATAKLVAVKQSADADKELYNQFIAKTGEKCD